MKTTSFNLSKTPKVEMKKVTEAKKKNKKNQKMNHAELLTIQIKLEATRQ